jgi:hypothetical protein
MPVRVVDVCRVRVATVSSPCRVIRVGWVSRVIAFVIRFHVVRVIRVSNNINHSCG